MAQTTIKNFLREALPDVEIDPRIDIPRQKIFGDYSSNIAIQTAYKLSKKPFELAEEIVNRVRENDKDNTFAHVEVARPGFINFKLSLNYLQNLLSDIHELDHRYGISDMRDEKKILLEFVSANPTGPLHIGHGRWAVIGDIIGRLLKATGHKTEKEFYVNNVGNQVEKLVQSVMALREGQPVPEGGYGGAYIKDVKGKNKKEILEYLLLQQKETLNKLGVNYDRWFYENELHDKNKVKMAVQKLHDLRVTFEEGGAIWFKSEEFGDDKNRVLIREDGNPTYFAADIAYHMDKFERGYDHLIDIWGTDHHGYVKRLKAAVKVLGFPVDEFEIIIGQLVTLYRGKEPIRMSKRTGEMITLKEVVEEIGADATRFFFAATDVNSHLDFDLELAKKKSSDNPVFYLQYAHARICSILKKSSPDTRPASPDLKDLKHEAERALMVKLLRWPDVVEESAKLRHPHRVTVYGKELAAAFHYFYEKCRVLGNPARLYLVDAARITLRNVLELLGISAPESM
ncbi:MAG: arginine--tRNA ligase [Candidatus Margulisiibacteriota bacterium]|nr:arginine--tRNA ligase [Candidatus Margulisiibacteriota bacterium]